MEFGKLESKHAEQIATLHIKGINTGFISSLGIDFVTALYEAIAKNKSSFGFVGIGLVDCARSFICILMNIDTNEIHLEFENLPQSEKKKTIKFHKEQMKNRKTAKIKFEKLLSDFQFSTIQNILNDMHYLK